MRLVEKLKKSDSEMAKRVGEEKRNTVRMTGASCTANFLLGTGKLLMGIYSASFFTCMNALYTYGMVAAKFCALKGIAAAQKKQYAYYRWAARVLMAASLFYALYSTRLLWHPEISHYHPYLAMGIATVTFAEIGLNIRGVWIERKKKALPFHAIKMINLASSLISLVLTQTAILSFVHTEPDYDPSRSNGLFGLCMGASATVIGLFMLWRSTKLKQQEEKR